MARVDDNRRKLIEYLSNPENEFITRTRMSIEVLGYSHKETMYQYFSPFELDEIEHEAFELRKKRSVNQQSEVYKALYDQAKKGNVQAAKEFLDRVSGKVDDVLNVKGKIDSHWIIETVKADVEK